MLGVATWVHALGVTNPSATKDLWLKTALSIFHQVSMEMMSSFVRSCHRRLHKSGKGSCRHFRSLGLNLSSELLVKELGDLLERLFGFGCACVAHKLSVRLRFIDL